MEVPESGRVSLITTLVSLSFPEPLSPHVVLRIPYLAAE